MKDLSRYALITISVMTVTACTQPISATDKVSKDWFGVGITRIKHAEKSSDLIAYERTTTGLGTSRDTVFLGWHRVQEVIADPANCQMVVIIRNGQELGQARTVLEQLKGVDICVADFS